MLKTIQFKLLLAILAVLIVIAGAVAYHRHTVAKAAVLREQQQYQRFRQQVEQDTRKHNSAASHESKTWQKSNP